jgi:hypothetical protein
MTIVMSLVQLAFAAPASAPPAGQLIDIWVRPSGDAPRKPISVDLSSKPKLEVTREDLQYDGAKAKYRGVPLRSLLELVERPGRNDLALLHFKNGMIVPLPIDDLELMKALDPFVATELQVNDLWIPTFPMVTKKGADQRDVRPLKFGFNKLVVGSKIHPYTTRESQTDGFSPFFFGDSLTGIELVRAENWYRQFDVGSTEAERRGFQVFKSHCQFCHASREVGGRYGIDFMKPKPVVERIGIQDLFLHVRYRDLNAPETGQMMPFFKDVQKDDVTALHAWLTALTKARAAPYVAP